MTDLLLDDNDDIKILNGDFDIGVSEMQEVGIILRLQQGALKSDPIIGCNNLNDFIRAKYDPTAVEKRVKLQLERDGKNYDTIKKQIKYNIGNG